MALLVNGQRVAGLGSPGVGIKSIERTGGDGTPGTDDIYTITMTDGKTSEFSVHNGADGVTPHVGDNGNWWIGETDTGIVADMEAEVDTHNSDTEAHADIRALIPTIASDIGAAPAVESTEYPGCYYRMVNGVQEWINPPVVIGDGATFGTEYPTTKKYNGKTVYARRIRAYDLAACTSAETSHTYFWFTDGVDELVHFEASYVGPYDNNAPVTSETPAEVVAKPERILLPNIGKDGEARIYCLARTRFGSSLEGEIFNRWIQHVFPGAYVELYAEYTKG